MLKNSLTEDNYIENKVIQQKYVIFKEVINIQQNEITPSNFADVKIFALNIANFTGL